MNTRRVDLSQWHERAGR